MFAVGQAHWDQALGATKGIKEENNNNFIHNRKRIFILLMKLWFLLNMMFDDIANA